MGSPIDFRIGLIADSPGIVGLVNSAYRGQSSKAGWTTEADLLGGQRTDVSEVSGLLSAQGSMFLLGLASGELVASVHLERAADAAKIGMLAVKPQLQGRGVGKELLEAAENAAIEAWQVKLARMAVLTNRSELIAFYERRGYRRTGCYEDFPADPKFGIPKVSGLRFEWLEKALSPPSAARS